MKTVSIKGNRIELRFDYDPSMVSQVGRNGLGLRWDKPGRCWWQSMTAEWARKVVDFAQFQGFLFQGDAIERLEAVINAANINIMASRMTSVEGKFPVLDGLDYLPFQKAGIVYAASKTGTLIGDEMGLGKTMQALGVINTDDTIKSVLIICPATLKLNWQREARKWLVRDMSVGIASTTRGVPNTDVVIVNYDILTKLRDRLMERHWDLQVADECHYVKNPKAARTRALIGRRAKKRDDRMDPIPADKLLFLTGTPIMNRPVELWPLVERLAPEVFDNFWQYAMRFCDGKRIQIGIERDRNGRPKRDDFGDVIPKMAWDFTGASNLDELHEKLRGSCMIRRLKSEVMKDLPPKVYQIIPLPANGAQGVINRQRKFIERVFGPAKDNPEAFAEQVARLNNIKGPDFEEFSRLRRETAEAKIKHLVEHLRNALEDEERKVVAFGHHREVIEAVAREFEDICVVVHGGVKMEERQVAVDRFQGDPKCRLFLGSIMAAGVGLTLTESQHVVFFEEALRPADISQAEDRCHRIGAKGEMILVQHLVFDESIDAYLANMVAGKQKIITAALDGELGQPKPAVNEVKIKQGCGDQNHQTRDWSREPPRDNKEQIAMEAEELRYEDERKLIHSTLESLREHLQHDSFALSMLDRESLSPKQAAVARAIIWNFEAFLEDPAVLEEIGETKVVNRTKPPRTAKPTRRHWRTMVGAKYNREEDLVAEAAAMTPEQIQAVHTTLQILSGRCDWAELKDGEGFNKGDTLIGHELAARSELLPEEAAIGRKMALKYRRQYGPDLYEQMGLI